MGLEIVTKSRQENLVSVRNPSCPYCIDILCGENVATPNTKTKEPMEPLEGADDKHF